ncbi:MAG: hypothetical protein PUE12_18035 [Oscillospiraceae bacterium]|nr:hypothetical protein [Oscillospiraceae bacterium]
MTKNEYDQLFRLLCQLQIEAPCHNRACVGYQQCEYGINGCYGEECAIEVVREVAYSKETRSANDT